MNPVILRASGGWTEYTKPGHVTMEYQFTANFCL